MSEKLAILSKSSSGSAEITVTYGSSFYDLPMTCSDGTNTYTKTTTSAGVTVFKVSSQGTWTITCNNISNTVEVVLNYTNEMHITKTFTIRSGKSDTVSFTDHSGSKTCTTNSTNGSGTVDITFVPGQEITFTSAVARDYNNISQRYSKTITLTDDTPTTLWIMPTEDGSNMIYWYGVILWSNLSGTVEYHYQSSAPPAASFNTNNIAFTANAKYQARAVFPSASSGYTLRGSDYTHVCADVRSNYSTSNHYAYLWTAPRVPTSWSDLDSIKYNYGSFRNTNGKVRIGINTTNNFGVVFGDNNGDSATTYCFFYGVWLE